MQNIFPVKGSEELARSRVCRLSSLRFIEEKNINIQDVVYIK